MYQKWLISCAFFHRNGLYKVWYGCRCALCNACVHNLHFKFPCGYCCCVFSHKKCLGMHWHIHSFVGIIQFFPADSNKQIDVRKAKRDIDFYLLHYINRWKRLLILRHTYFMHSALPHLTSFRFHAVLLLCCVAPFFFYSSWKQPQ